MNSTEIMSVTVNPGEAREVRDTDTPDLETTECGDNPHITSSFEEIESATQAHTEGPNSFNRYWQKYHTVLGHVIIWVLSTSCGDTYLRN
jgi:hypothetical protein